MKKINRLSSYKDAPWPDENIVQENENIVVYRDGYPVTEGHLLFVPKKVERQLDITRCFELAYKWGVRGVCNYEYEAFNVGINNGEAAGQSVMWPHVHLIPRRKGDTPYPKGGVRHVIPLKGNYDDTTEDGWENEGGMALPVVDDNTPREELDNWKNGVSKRRKILFHHWYDKDGRMVQKMDKERKNMTQLYLSRQDKGTEKTKEKGY